MDLNPSLNFAEGKQYNLSSPGPETVVFKSLFNIEHPSVVGCARFSSDGSLFATGGDRSAFIFDVDNFYLLKAKFAIHHENDMFVRALAFSHDASLLFTGSEDGMLRVWCVRRKIMLHTFVGHTGDITAVDASRQQKDPLVASGSSDGCVRLWDFDTGKCVTTITLREHARDQVGVTSLLLGPECAWVAMGDSYANFYVYTRSGEQVFMNQSHTKPVYGMSLSPTTSHLVCASLDTSLSLWDASRAPTTITPAGRLESHVGMVFSCLVSDDGQWLLSGSADQTICIHNMHTHALVSTISGIDNAVIAIQWRRGHLIALFSDNAAHIFQLEVSLPSL
eukprot:m.147771 g.147771  ORF g.147771 m.147771 type:complete len:336 (+) comp15044_c1_seq2:6-1013(+)